MGLAVAKRGTLDKLARRRQTTWRGWAIYHWDMCHCVALFKKKPKLYTLDKPHRTWEFTDAIERVSVDFLQACGIKWPYDGTKEFYYGGPLNLHSQHPPIKIELRLPKVLLEQLGLD